MIDQSSVQTLKAKQAYEQFASKHGIGIRIATISVTMDVLPTMHSDSMQSNNSKHSPFAASMLTSRMTLQKERFRTVPNQQGSNCCMQGHDGQNAYIGHYGPMP